MNQPKVIEVLWQLEGGRSVWWGATILQLNSKYSTTLKGATASIRYGPGHGHSATNAAVEFLSDHILKQIEEGVELRLSWRSRSRALKSKKESVKANTPPNQSLEKIGKEVRKLRSRLIENNVQLDVMRKKIELTSSSLEDTMATKDERMHCLLSFIRHRIVLQLQRPVCTRAQISRRGNRQEPDLEGIDGVSRTYIRASVDCDLKLFEDLARYVRSARPGNDTDIQFNPSYARTQCPAQGSRGFAVIFSRLAILCELIGVTSTDDRLEMLQKYGIAEGEGVMRLLGSYTWNRQDENDPSSIHVGQSCGHSTTEDVDETAQPVARYPLLARESREWNVEDRRYTHPARLQWEPHRPLCFGNSTDTRDHFFHLAWRRAPDAKPRTWSRSVAYPKYVMGKLDIVLPCVVLEGNVLCDDVSALLPKSVLIRAVQ